MKKSIILSWIVFSFLTTRSQDYKVRTDKTDEFSIALVRLLNCAVTNFIQCKGEHIQYTMMQENEYRLTIDFPGAAAAIVRERDSWDKNAYVEFRGFKNLKSLQNGIKDLVKKIQYALGDQMNPDHSLHSGADSSWFLSGMGIRDQQGYFSSNMELMTGSSGSSSYLLEKSGNKSYDNTNKEYFILLKVQRGIPAYYHYIQNNTTSPDQILNSIIKDLVEAAPTDFEKFRKKDKNVFVSRYADTIQTNGHTIYFRYGGQNYKSTMMFPSSSEKSKLDEKWKYYQQVVHAALGTEYVYHLYSYDARLNDEVGQGKPFIVYFRKDYKQDQARVYLEVGEDSKSSPVIFIRVESSISHPVKRNLSYPYE